MSHPLAILILRHAAGPEKFGQRGRHHRAIRQARTRAQALVVEKEEGFVLLDGTPDRGAEIIPLKARLLHVEVVPGVQGAVAEVFVGSAVQVVGARLADRVNGRAGAAEFRAVGVASGGLALDHKNGSRPEEPL